MITGRAYEYSVNAQTKKMCWYVMPSSSTITARVGHSAVFVRDEKRDTATDSAASDGLIYIIGGADPSGVYNDVFTFNLASQNVDKVRTNNTFEGRYEHACCYVQNLAAVRQGDKGGTGANESARRGLLIWAGAVQTGNLNDILFLDVDTAKWQSIKHKGEPPSSRTCHLVAGALHNGVLPVFSGGEQGTLPVDDEHVHTFSLDSFTWTNVTRETSTRRGSQSHSPRSGRPKPRQGHVSLVCEGEQGGADDRLRLLVHGGLAGYTFFDDFWQFDLRARTWERVQYANVGPCGRAAHAGALHAGCVYLFGGLTERGASSELWKFELQTAQWTLVEMRGAVPAARLCFAMCLCEMPARVRKGQRELDEASMSSVNTSMNENMLLEAAANECASLGGSLSARSHDESMMSARLNELRLNDEFDEQSGPSSARSENSFCDSARSAQLRPPLDDALFDRTLMPALFVHGGMNTEGDLFDDAYICVLP